MKKIISKLRLPKGKVEWQNLARKNPSITLITGGCVLLLIIWGVSFLSESPPPRKSSAPEAPPKMVSVSSQIDPRDTWTRDVQETVRSFQEEIIKMMKEEREATKQEIASIRTEAQTMLEEALKADQNSTQEESPTLRVIDPELSSLPETSPSPTLGYSRTSVF